jgi:hypothetical protein
VPASGALSKMENWDSDFLDLVEEAHPTFEGKSDGEIAIKLLAFGPSVKPLKDADGLLYFAQDRARRLAFRRSHVNTLTS